MFLFLSMIVIIFSMMVMEFVNVFFWWSIFLLMTMIFLFYNKVFENYLCMINYFVFQEVLGLLFLVFFFSYFPCLILMLKIGVSPFHFWLFKVINSMSGFPLIFFLTFHKLPFVMVFLQVFSLKFVFLLFFGLLITTIQMFLLKSFKYLLMVSSVDSFSWIFMGLLFSFFNVFFLLLYYFLIMVILLFKFGFGNNFIENYLELFLVFINVPFTMGFFIKVFLMMSIFFYLSFFFLILLFLMFLSVMSITYWMIYLFGNVMSLKLNMNYYYFFVLMYFLLI